MGRPSKKAVAARSASTAAIPTRIAPVGPKAPVRLVAGEDAPKREAILAAALELFAERGFHGTAVPLIAERARVGAGTVYRYFESKEAIVNELFRYWKRALTAALVRDVNLAEPVRQMFHGLFWRFARFAKEHPQVMAFLEVHLHGAYLDDESRAVEAELLLPIKAFVEAAQAQQAVKPVAPELLIALVWGAFVGMFRAHWMGYLELSDQSLEHAESCMWEAIRR